LKTDKRASNLFRNVKDKRKLIKADTIFIFDPKVHMNLTDQEIKYLDKIEEYEKNYDWFIEIANLESGKSFGEKALIEDKPRAASIQAITDCHFAVLKKETYIKFLRKQETRMLNAKLDFFSSLPFLKG
jgi:CRP-like cAMP-binding protein